jgi:hypothetical protein
VVVPVVLGTDEDVDSVASSTAGIRQVELKNKNKNNVTENTIFIYE